jgi:hypothetical protein
MATVTVAVGARRRGTARRCDLIRSLHDITTDVVQRNHGDALNNLNDILRRVDGCTASGAPDRDAWIIDCQVQEAV